MQETRHHLLLEIKNKTAYITVNRPAQLNALSADTLNELAAALASYSIDDRVRGVIVTGSGDKAFVAGADIGELQRVSADDVRQLAKSAQEEVMDVLYAFPKPVIAAINGFALGGGLELAMACHIRVAGEQVKLGLPEVSLGLIPGYGGTQRLPQLVGRGKALEIIMTGEMITAKDALRWGLVNHVVSADELIPFCEKLLGKIYERSKPAIATAIKMVNKALDDPKHGYDDEIDAFANLRETPEAEEGLAAFLEKRKPNF